MHIEMWPIGRVVPYEKNPRIHAGAVEAVAKSILEFGWRPPIVVNRGYANCANYPPVLKRHGLYSSQAIIWVKEQSVLTRTASWAITNGVFTSGLNHYRLKPVGLGESRPTD
jgi:hypothetical protein